MPVHPARRRAWQIINYAHGHDALSSAVDYFISTLIVLNVAAAIIETVKPYDELYKGTFAAFEVFSVVVFTIEYGVRLWASAELDPSLPAWRSRLRWATSGGALVDLIAVAPSWLLIVGGPGMDTRTVRALRLMRLFRLLKFGRYHHTVGLLARTVADRRDELIVSLSFVVLLLLVVSTLVYHVEHDAQKEAFSSIPATMWWGIATLTTVGYGDIAPITPLGRFFGGIAALLGIGMFALPAGILSAAFSDALSQARAELAEQRADAAEERAERAEQERL